MTTLSISYHITGNYPLRIADAEDQAMPCKTVCFPCGFECLAINVYGDSLNESDYIEAAAEFLQKTNPNWTDDWEGRTDDAYIFHAAKF